MSDNLWFKPVEEYEFVFGGDLEGYFFIGVALVFILTAAFRGDNRHLVGFILTAYALHFAHAYMLTLDLAFLASFLIWQGLASIYIVSTKKGQEITRLGS